MDRDELIRQLMTTFLGELEEHVGSLNRDLLALEKGPGPDERAELITVLFRTVHSLKGAARSVGVEPVEAACHRLEDIFAAFRDGRQEPAADTLELLFSAADAIKDAGVRLAAERSLDDSLLVAVNPRLEAAVSDSRGPSSTYETAPARTERSKKATWNSNPTPPPLPEKDGSPIPTETMAGVPSDRSPVPSEEGFVRISTAKLDTLVNSAGELLVARRRAARRQAEVTALEDVAKAWRSDWAAVQKTLLRLLPDADHPNVAAPGRSLADARRLTTAADGINDAMGRLVRGLDQLGSHLGADSRDFEQVAGPMESGVRGLRMVRFTEACAGFARVVRDLAKVAGKEIDLVVQDHQVEIDRAVLQELNDALLHLVRNAVDHGIETPAERKAAGKPETGQISLTATVHGGQVEIVIADDGRGIDIAAIRQLLERKNLPVPDDEQSLIDALFSPGISTAAIITEVSGRGVGLDVVRNAVESLRGTVDVSFDAGKGTRFLLNVPLTLSTLQALTVRVGRQSFALDISAIEGLRRVRPSDLHSAEGREVLSVDGRMVPVGSLAGVLGLAETPEERGDGKLSVVIARVGKERAALVVDELLAEQEIVVKTLGRRLKRIRHAAGATVLPSGEIALILKPQSLIQSILGHAPGRTLFAGRADRPVGKKKRVLLVEDSVTTRTLEANILEMAGYEVILAVDGAQAWQLLQDRGADLVVSDIEMPKMDGFALTEAVRASKRFRDLPVVLVTALATDADRARGMEVGAEAYLLKSMFDQKELLATIEQLL